MTLWDWAQHNGVVSGVLVMWLGSLPVTSSITANNSPQPSGSPLYSPVPRRTDPMLSKIKTAVAALARKAKPVIAPAVRAFASAAFAALVASGADWAHITDMSTLEKAAIAGVAAGLPVLEAAISALLSSGHALTLGNAFRYRSALAKARKSGAVR